MKKISFVYFFLTLFFVSTLTIIPTIASAQCTTSSEPTAGLTNPTFAITGAGNLQPGAYTQVQLTTDISLSGGMAKLWTACGGGSSDPIGNPAEGCPVYVSTSCNGGFQSTNAVQIGTCVIQSWNRLSTDGGTCTVTGYTSGNDIPGTLPLCYEVVVTPYAGGLNGGGCPNENEQGSPPYPTYYVSPYVPPETTSGSYSIDGPALAVSVSPEITLTQGQSATFAFNTVGQQWNYPTYLELADPGNNIYCTSGGVPACTTTTGCAGNPGAQTNYGSAFDTLPFCTSTPSQSSLPCVLSYSTQSGSGGGPGGAGGPPYPGEAAPVIIDTQGLAANTYAVCGYEGWYPQAPVGDQLTGPWPVFFTSTPFTVQCPVTGCSNLLPPSGPELTTGALQAELCSLYFTINETLAILALMLVILGGVLYGAGNAMPGYTRGTIQGYAMGLIFAGIVSLIISTGAVYVLSVVSNSSLTAILALNACVP